MGLLCNWRFSFHEFYNFFLFNLLILIFFLVNSLLFSILFLYSHDTYPRRYLFLKFYIYNFFLFIYFTTHDPRPTRTTHDLYSLPTSPDI